MVYTHNWTDERIELLKKLWADGKSASQIVEIMGGVSRNAVIGKVHRLNLPVRQDYQQPLRAARIIRTPRMPKKKPEPAKVSELQKFIDRAPPPVADSIPMPKSLGLTLMELENHNCRWPAGEREHITFCGHQIEQGRSYCAYHVRLSRGKGTESERRAARELMRAA